MSFRRIYYDSYHNKLYFWETVDGKNNKEILNPDFVYYVKDPTGKSEIKDIYGIPVKKIVSKSRDAMKELLQGCNYSCESDINPDIKFLQEKYRGQELQVDMSIFNIAIVDIEVSAKEFPKADEAKYPINLFTVYYTKSKQFFTYGLKEYTGTEVKNYHQCETEKILLERFVEDWRKQSVDIISGWNSNAFDIPYLIKRLEKNQVERSLSPINIINKKKDADEYVIAGIASLDYIELYKKYEATKQERYSLGYISSVELGKTKLDFDGAINDLADRDWNKFVEYNVQDVTLVKELDEKKRYIELTVTVAYQALVPFEKVGSSVTMHTGYILNFLHRKGLVLPDRIQNQEKKEIPGGHVFSEAGFHQYVVNFDVESLYPTLIRQFNISPETLVMNPIITEHLIKTPISKEHGVYYKKEKGVLSEIVEKIFNERKLNKNKQKTCKIIEKYGLAKLDETYPAGKQYLEEIEREKGNSDYYDIQQYVRKIMINSLYGVLANEYFHFYNPYNAMAITLGGQGLIKFLSENINSYFKEFFYKNKTFFPVVDEKNKLKKDVDVLTDTDSIYLCFDEIVQKLNLSFKTHEEFLTWIEPFVNTFIQPLFEKMLTVYAQKYDVPQIINFRREKIGSAMLVLAKKRYILEVIDDEGIRHLEEPKYVVKGVELVRTDTPQFCRDKLLETVKMMFQTRDREKVIDYMKQLKKEFKQQPIGDIATPTGISEYSNVFKPIEYYLSNGISYPKGCTMHGRAALNHNFMASKNNLNLQLIGDSTKMKFIYLNDSNLINQNIIGFINNWPENFNKYFKVDYETQWEKSFQTIIQRFFEVMGWGEISFNNKLSKFFE